MNLNEIPEVQQHFEFGPNTMTLQSYDITEGKYGKQIHFVFSKAGAVSKDGTPLTQQFWLQMSDAFTSEEGWKFMVKLQQFKDVIAVKESNPDEFFAEVKKSAPAFENTNQESVQNFQVNFLKKFIEPVLGEEMTVLLHYKGKYLNIPSYKENNYELPFGKNPIQSSKLNRVKGESVSVETETVEAASADPNAW